MFSVNRLDVDLKSVIYNSGILFGSDEDWEFLWQRFLKEQDDTEKRKLIQALGRTKEVSLLSR